MKLNELNHTAFNYELWAVVEGKKIKVMLSSGSKLSGVLTARGAGFIELTSKDPDYPEYDQVYYIWLDKIIGISVDKSLDFPKEEKYV